MVRRVFLILLAGLAFGTSSAHAEKKSKFRKTYTTSEKRVVRAKGLVRPENWEVSSRFEEINVRADLPTQFDWRDRVPFGLQPIRNQKNCGSCWAFATTAVVEALMIIARPDMFWPDLSEQELVSTCCGAGDCGGGYFTAFDYVAKKGQGEEVEFPYIARNSSCKKITPRVKLRNWSYISNPNTEKLKTAIYQYGPIACDVNATGEMQNYQSGVFNSCASGQTDHMVTIEGWNEDEKYWIMRNSWGKDWGMDGYMHIKYTSSSGKKCNSLCSVAAYAELE